MLRKGNGKSMTLGDIRDKGLDAYALMGVDRTTGYLKRTTSNLAIKTTLEVNNVVEVANVVDNVNIVEITPINKPSDRFDIEDYLLYEEYMIANGGVPSIEDYFKAIEYYKSRA